MQSSLVEEVISFAVLDNVTDLTAVSLFAVCMDGFECQILSNTHHCKRESSIQQPNSTPVHSQTKADSSQPDSLGTECRQVELTREENVATLQINRVHCQLRRLLKNSNFSDHVMLTAIPEHRSTVSFTFDHTAYPLSTSSSPFPSSPRKRVSLQQQSVDWQDDLTIGFIMFEGGLENISVTAVRRLGYTNTVDVHLQSKMDNIEKVLEDMQQTTRDHITQMTRTATSSTDDQPPSTGSGGEHSSDNLHSWDSTRSIASKDSNSIAPPPKTEPLEGDASNGSLNLKTIWMNFAAPPPISIKKKVDFTWYNFALCL